MLVNETGVLEGSDLFVETPSQTAKSLFFYLHRCGRFICDEKYEIEREDFQNYLLMVDVTKSKTRAKPTRPKAAKSRSSIATCRINTRR